MFSNLLNLSVPSNIIRNKTLSSLLVKRLASSTQAAVSQAPDEKKELKKEDEGRPDDLYRYLWIRCQAHDSAILNSYEKFLNLAAQNLNIEYVKTEEPFRRIERKTLLASRHVHKKYRVQYEHRTYYRDVLFKNLTGSTADTFLEYVERNLPEGVLFIAEKHRIAELPFELENDNETSS